jgi:hypothetical protein
LIGDSFDTRADLDKMAKKKVPDPARNWILVTLLKAT